jgi:diguanylate cyclase (GGDEF)-like protein
VTDPVTGAYARAGLEPCLAAAVAGGEPFTLYLFDLDFFKTINDVYGHLRGDEVLRALCDRIKATLRPGDLLFRYGGDEFVVLLPGSGQTDALDVALRLTDHVRTHEFPGDPPLHLSISLGLASYPLDGADATSLLARADRRNYSAKRRGRGSAVADDADVGMDTATSRLWERDAALTSAHEFLTRLQASRQGALRVHGEPGAGHTRFLQEVATIAGLRGYSVVPLGPAPQLPAPGTRHVLLIGDVDTAATAAATISVVTRGPDPPDVLGLVYATSAGRGSPTIELPLLDTVELAPWSLATMRIWLRSALSGEPSRVLLTWIAGHSGGLPARAARALERLRERNGLVPAEGGGWTVAPSVLGRPRRRTRLPVPMTPLVGRDTDRDRVAKLVLGGRLVTLIGPGGIGKTRLSLAVAGALAGRFDDGVAFVPLAETTDTDLAVAAIAQALEVSEVPGQPLLDSIIEHLGEASMLLVLDNFEQVLGAARAVSEILAAAPGVTMLTTSRERLQIYGEQVYQVPPLAESTAIALFAERAQAINPDFAVSPQTLPAVVELCQRLDGLPLAIELAAARTDRWSPRALLDHLADHLDAYESAPRDRPERQQTLRGAIEWSFVLLDERDQQLFTRLAVFAGGWTVDAAQAVSTLDSEELTERLFTLVGKSLLVAEPEADGTVRHRMLETIRGYAASRLAAAAEAEAVRGRHAAYYVGLAERSGIGMTGHEQAEWVERLEREYQNLRAAVTWTLSHGDVTSAARICLGLWRYWRNGHHIGEGRVWLSNVLSARYPLSDEVRAKVLHPAAVLAAAQDDHANAYLLGADSLRLAEAVGDRQTTAQARNALGIAAIGAGDYELAAEHFRHSLALWQQMEVPQGTAAALGNLTKLALRLGEVAAADEYAAQCLALERSSGNTRGILLALECTGAIRLAQGDLTGARAALRESLALSRTLGDVFGEAMALHQLGLAAHADGDDQEALALLTAALTRRHDVGDREDLAVSLDRIAHHIVGSRPELAVRLLSAADGLRYRHRLPLPPESDTRRQSTVAAARLALDERTYASASATGRQAPLDVIVEEALDLSPL